jgi:glycosyltransferase involved in cell wall biosynthesis
MSARHEPSVSVVVPIYNVEPFLHECLESLAHQTMRDIQVVMVDDGSTDGSARIAGTFAARDPRFVLVRRPNGGLGAARNTGADRATGEYLAFVDSDDVVLPHAYELLASSLGRTGSDIAAGNVRRLTTSGTRQAGVVAIGFSANRPRTHVRKHPALLYDRTAWNKLYRRSFWDQHGFRWPEGVLYEDISVTVPAHVLARAVDVLRDPIYLWRERAGESASITQRRTELRAIRDRFTAVDGVSRFLTDRRETKLKRVYDRSVAEQDFKYFLDELDQATDEFRDEFMRLVNDFFDRADPTVFDHLPALQRLEWHLVRRRRLPELLEVIRFEKSGLAAWHPWIRQGRAIYGGYPFRGDPQLAVPKDVYRITKDEIPVTARIEQVWWDGGVLRLSGYAFIAFVAAAHEHSGRVRLTLEESGHPESVVRLSTRRVRRPDVTELHSADGTSYDWSGWEASVPLTALRQGEHFRAGDWRLRLELRGDGVTRRMWLSATDPGSARRPGWRFVNGAHIVPTTPSGHFAVQVRAEYAAVESMHVGPPHLVQMSGVVSGRQVDRRETVLLAIRSGSFEATRFGVDWIPGAQRFASQLDLTALNARQAEEPATWELYLHTGDDATRLPLSAARALGGSPAAETDGRRETYLRVTRTSRILVERRRRRPAVDRVELHDGAPVLGGRHTRRGVTTPDIVLRNAAVPSTTTIVPSAWQGDRFAVDVSAIVDRVAGAGTEGPVADGRWDLLLHDHPESSELVPFEAAEQILEALPVFVRRGDRLMTLTDDDQALALFVAGKGSSAGPRSTPPLRPRPKSDSFVLGTLQDRELVTTTAQVAPAARIAHRGAAVNLSIRAVERVVPRQLLRKVPPLWRARLVRAVARAGRLGRH